MRPYALLGQQTSATTYSLLNDAPAPAAPEPSLLDPKQAVSGMLDAVKSIAKTFVVEPLSDLKLTAEVLLDRIGDAAYSKAPLMQQQRLEAGEGAEFTEEQLRRSRRGMALALSAVVAGPAGSAMRALGARALLKQPVMATAPRLMEGIIRTGGGAAEGVAVGATYGAFKPLDDIEDSRGQAVAFDAIAGGLFGTLFGGYGALRAGRAKEAMTPETRTLLGQSLRETAQDDAAAILAGRMQRAQMLPEPLDVDEIGARVAAGVYDQGPTKAGLFGRLRESAGNVADVISIRFPSLKKMDPELHTSALAVADASTTGAWFGKRAAQFIEDGLSEEERSLFWRGLIASRGRQIKRNLQEQAAALADGSTISINGKQYDAEALQRLAAEVAIPELAPTEEVLFSTNPAVAAAKRRYAEQVLPLITDIRQRNGLQTLANTDEPFVPLVRYVEDQHAGMARASASPTAGFGNTFATRTTPGAKMALGQSEYVANGEAILSAAMGRDFAVDRKNEFIARVVSAPWAQRLSRGEKPPATILVNGVEEAAAVIEIKGNPRVLKDRFNVAAEEAALQLAESGDDSLLHSLETEDAVPGSVVEDVLGRYLVPKTVAKTWNELFNPLNRRNEQRLFETKLMDPIHKFMDFNVGLLLASPVEVTAHSSRILSILSRLPSIGDDQGALQIVANKLIPWFGPRLGGLRSIYNLYDNPAAMAMEARLAKVPGAIPSRAFEGEFKGGIGTMLPGKAAHILEGGRKFIFDLPEQGSHGLHGFDIRSRIAAALTAERIAGRRLTDTELSEFLTQFGTYSNGIQSNIASGLRRSRLNPFAGGQAGIIPAEVRGFFGSTNLPATVKADLSKATMAKLNAEVLWRGTVGTALMMTVLQKALVDKFPWENEPGHEEDLMVGYTEDGRGVYVPFHSFAPDLARAARITGVRALAENFGPDAIPAALLDMANTAITYSSGGPGTNALRTLTTGNAAFTTGPGQVLQVVPPQPTALLTMKERFLTAASSSNPTIENFLGVGPAKIQPPAVRIINALTPGMEVGRLPLLRVSAELRGEKAEFYAVVEDRVNRAYMEGMTQAERIQFYRQEAIKFPEEQRLLAMRQMLMQDQQKQRSTLRSAVEAIGGLGPF